jgi:4-alpha-glucanotransferase
MAKDYHAYVQWLAEEQMSRVAKRARHNGVGLYLDLPLGVHQDGYDVWRQQECFALDAAGGAPPDPVFTKGQDWGFAPLHPSRLREHHHRYFIEVLRHHLRHARMLRIDHVMGLHRLYWVPRGLPATHGAYVSYPSEELHAILNLESHRHEAVIIGENLGTVPPAVNTAMKRHGMRPMYVVQYELRPRKDRPLGAVPSGALASINTHDMPPWKAFWDGLDIEDRIDLGLLDDEQAREERKVRHRLRKALVAFLRKGSTEGPREADAASVLRACLRRLGRSAAGSLLVTLEDLWLETEPQNTPGTSTERINWRRRIRHSLEALRRLPDVPAVLDPLVRVRSRARSAKACTRKTPGIR